MLGKASALWNVHYDSGRLEIVEPKPKHITLRIVDFETPHCLHCRSVFGWAERSVELSGGKDVSASYTDCRRRGASACGFTLAYR